MFRLSLLRSMDLAGNERQSLFFRLMINTKWSLLFPLAIVLWYARLETVDGYYISEVQWILDTAVRTSLTIDLHEYMLYDESGNA